MSGVGIIGLLLLPVLFFLPAVETVLPLSYVVLHIWEIFTPTHFAVPHGLVRCCFVFGVGRGWALLTRI